MADALAKSEIHYMLAGSFSSNFYGIPRSTKDADFVVELISGVGSDFMKLRCARARDKDDVRAVLGVQRGKLDWNYIEGRCDQHGTRARLEEIRRTVPEV